MNNIVPDLSLITSIQVIQEELDRIQIVVLNIQEGMEEGDIKEFAVLYKALTNTRNRLAANLLKNALVEMLVDKNVV